jgi:hypothetical protein
LVVQAVVQNPEMQSAYHGVKSALPDKSYVTAHTAAVLWLVKKASIPKVGWVGEDSWFGTVTTAVKVMTRFVIHSTWIIKQNKHWFPMKPLCAVLKACYKD